MSLEKKCEENIEQIASRPKNIEEAVGSHYALQVAIQTMKERCQQLQLRLETLEQENLRLRIENRKLRSDTVSNSVELQNNKGEMQRKIDDLEEKVAEFERTKSHLKHHLCMVATENKQLWNRLSHLTQANQNLGSHLSKISNTLSRHHSASSITMSKSQSPNNSFSEETSKECSDAAKEPNSPNSKVTEGVMDASLQEISLKIFHGILQNKTDLEDQCAQMVEIQSDSYNIGLECLEDDDEVLEDLKRYHNNLLKLRDQMLEQQSAMKTALDNLHHGIKGDHLCSNCKEKSKPALTEANVELEAEIESLRQWGTPDANVHSSKHLEIELMAEKICPMCGKLYGKETPFNSFQQHVSDHFTDDDETYSIINNFEVIT
ncbi:hypothetical protein L9F63_009421 [Diploptera punctata]|uniref:UBZ1-type domain-containing protein n=1 Tax=Diploptera punctata TaxID=6984 RepID=A0AAD8ESB6_DIPPU|nr:hypothetical protein L9F63_009421 [Diploptera punctata]